jgi:hypothetical protein
VYLTSLDRLAADAGGRFSERTNDLSLGYARAQRDQACIYTIGFYDDPVPDRARAAKRSSGPLAPCSNGSWGPAGVASRCV